MSELGAILAELQKQGEKPLSIHVDGAFTYIIYGARSFSNNGTHETIYPILRVNVISANSTAIDQSALRESDRSSVDLKNDYAGTITLMAGLIFG